MGGSWDENSAERRIVNDERRIRGEVVDRGGTVVRALWEIFELEGRSEVGRREDGKLVGRRG